MVQTPKTRETLDAGGVVSYFSRIARTRFAAGRSQQRVSHALTCGHFPINPSLYKLTYDIVSPR